ncbi:MAG TPA: 5-(carboxyamino)imidazole ribonucleotide synthase [Thermoanaerobaculia bacterium]|nr:5-(carboxyamino)imidazole ribonucleotide synthase [Thermoanaerobaculia bacterium]
MSRPVTSRESRVTSHESRSAILPGSTVGVLGSGQLGRLFAIAARRMGYRVHTFSPDDVTPTGQVSDREISAPYEDLDAVRAFARAVDVVTFEFENVPDATARAAAEIAPVRPSGDVLHVVQNRIREKGFLAREGFPVVEFAAVTSAAELEEAAARIGAPSVLKTARSGYDGKGQAKIEDPSAALAAWEALGRVDAILERFVDFETEISVVVARALDGALSDFGAIENEHRRHILDVSRAPAGVSPAVAAEAARIGRAIAERLDVVGVICIEFFVDRGGKLLVNELAPRPHNSGHLTIDACVTSQFEQQLRAVCGLALGSGEYVRPAAMANLLGDLWTEGEPDWEAVCAIPDVKLHLYGKNAARPGRKMGHLTALGRTADEAREKVLRARARLARDPSPERDTTVTEWRP